MKPALKEKKRYIVFRVHAEEPVPFDALHEAVEQSLLEFLGEERFARAKPKLIRNLTSQGTGFLQTSPAHVDAVKVGLALIHQIGDTRVIFQTLKVSGTIASGKKALPPARKAAR
ncbi:MAG: hypothetical protein HY369_04555 [Candidatus Aenigmarchaeota archaeon]|nr:hypothetical protein [Candidatus Aenigmarchaeota archaeon]